jgi:hypothetical protein
MMMTTHGKRKGQGSVTIQHQNMEEHVQEIVLNILGVLQFMECGQPGLYLLVIVQRVILVAGKEVNPEYAVIQNHCMVVLLV